MRPLEPPACEDMERPPAEPIHEDAPEIDAAAPAEPAKRRKKQQTIGPGTAAPEERTYEGVSREDGTPLPGQAPAPAAEDDGGEWFPDEEAPAPAEAGKLGLKGAPPLSLKGGGDAAKEEKEECNS